MTVSNLPSPVAIRAGTLLILIMTMEDVATLSFTAEPMDAIVWAGSSILLPCYVDASDTLSSAIVWYRNRQTKLPGPFSQNNNGSLTVTIPHAAINYWDYDGQYHCVVSNKLRSRDASLRVSRPTTLGKLAGNQKGIFRPGETVGVLQEGYFRPFQPPAWNVWCSGNLKTAVACPSTTCNISYSLYPIARQKSLSLLTLTLSQLRAVTGDINCTKYVLRSVWERDHTNDLRMVLAGAFTPKLIVRPVNATAAKGGDVSLPCLANSISSYTWTKDGKSINITAEPRMSLKDGSLQIKDLADEDAGDYVCIVRIQDRDVRSSSPAALQVYVRPTVESLSLTTLAFEVTVSCKVSGSRPLSVQLLRDGLNVTSAIFTRTESAVLTYAVPAVIGSIVQCVASNEYGSTQNSRYIDAATLVSPSPTRRDVSTRVTTSVKHDDRTRTLFINRTLLTTPSLPSSLSPLWYSQSLLVHSVLQTPSPVISPPFPTSLLSSPSPSEIPTVDNTVHRSGEFCGLKDVGTATGITVLFIAIAATAIVGVRIYFRRRSSTYWVSDHKPRGPQKTWNDNVYHLDIPHSTSSTELTPVTPVYASVGTGEGEFTTFAPQPKSPSAAAKDRQSYCDDKEVYDDIVVYANSAALAENVETPEDSCADATPEYDTVTDT